MVYKNYTHGGDIYRNSVKLDFSVNINPLGMPDKVRDAIRLSADMSHIYPDPYCETLRRSLSLAHTVSVDDIICGAGAAELIFQFMHALKPARALIVEPTFSEYASALKCTGCDISSYELKAENGFILTDDILTKITFDTELLVICSPNNPTGIPVDHTLLGKIIERCHETNTWLFLDECFITMSSGAKSMIPTLCDGDKVFVLRAFTKSFAMAGVRLGYGICKNHCMLEKMCALSQPWNVSVTAQMAGVAALSCTEFIEETKLLIERERAYLEGQLDRLNEVYIKSVANFILIRERDNLGELLLKKGILIRDCSDFLGLKGYWRIAVRTRRENEQLIAAMKEIIDG